MSLVGRSLVVGLLASLVLAALPPMVNAEPRARLASLDSPANHLPIQAGIGGDAERSSRDVGGPDVSGERDGEVIVTVPGSPQEPSSAGKPGRLGEVQRQGSVVAVFEDPFDPLIVIAVENGYLTVRLRCGLLCPSIHLGDYVVAEGRRRSEAVLDAVEVWVVAP
jgi:hypothetical protein